MTRRWLVCTFPRVGAQQTVRTVTTTDVALARQLRSSGWRPAEQVRTRGSRSVWESRGGFLLVQDLGPTR